MALPRVNPVAARLLPIHEANLPVSPVSVPWSLVADWQRDVGIDEFAQIKNNNLPGIPAVAEPPARRMWGDREVADSLALKEESAAAMQGYAPRQTGGWRGSRDGR